MRIKVADFDGERNTWFYAEIEQRQGRDPRHPRTFALELTVTGEHTGCSFEVRRAGRDVPGGVQYATERSYGLR